MQVRQAPSAQALARGKAVELGAHVGHAADDGQPPGCALVPAQYTHQGRAGRGRDRARGGGRPRAGLARRLGTRAAGRHAGVPGGCALRVPAKTGWHWRRSRLRAAARAVLGWAVPEAAGKKREHQAGCVGQEVVHVKLP